MLLLLPSVEERFLWLSGQAPEELLLAKEEQEATLLVPGCISQVYLKGTVHADRCTFRCAADSQMVRGLVLTQLRLVQGLPAQEIASAEFTWLEHSRLAGNISPTRLQGLAAVASTLRKLVASES